MAESHDSARFKHRKVNGGRMLEAVCTECRVRLAVSPRAELLRAVERLHRCNPLRLELLHRERRAA